MTNKQKSAAICLCIMIPVLPFALLHLLGQGLIIATEWLCQDRAWTDWFLRRTEAVERYYKVDADTEYAESLVRRRAHEAEQDAA